MEEDIALGPPPTTRSDARAHDGLAEAFPPSLLVRDDAPDCAGPIVRYARWQQTRVRHESTAVFDEDVEGGFVASVDVLVDAGLLDDENRASESERGVQLVDTKRPEGKDAGLGGGRHACNMASRA